MQLWLDATFVQYFIAVLVAVYGSGLFTWWWAKHQKASFVFMCVTMMFVGDIIERSIQLYARYIRLTTCTVDFSATSPVWAYKGLVSTLVSFAVVIYMTGRVLDSWRGKS